MDFFYPYQPNSCNGPYRQPPSQHAAASLPSPPPDYSPYDEHTIIQSSSRSSHSFGPGPYTSPSSANMAYGNPSPASSPRDYFSKPSELDGIELNIGSPVSSLKQSKSKRSGKSNSPGVPSLYPCLFPDCGYSSGRAYDLKRHANVHSKMDTYPCKYLWCGRHKDGKPFSRHDHLEEHLRNVHMKDIPKKMRAKNEGGRM